MGQARRRPAEPIAETAAAEGEGGGGPPGQLSGVFADWNWEWLLGGNWLARIGIVAIIFGVAFFISLAIDRGWLGEAERVILGVAGGLAFTGAGEYFRRRYGVWAQTVTGGGIAILYLSVYGAFALYGLISTELAFGAFAIITLAGALLSLRHEAMGVAVLSIFGGFATPLLLQEQLPDQRLLLVYVLVLDVGVLALAGFRNWRWFTLLGWAGSLILFAFWQTELEPSVALAQTGITVIFLLFAGATIAFHVVRQQAAGIADLALVTLNAAGYYGISYWLMNDPYRDWMGGVHCAGGRVLRPAGRRLSDARAGTAQPDAVLCRVGRGIRCAGRPDTVGRAVDQRCVGNRGPGPDVAVLPAQDAGASLGRVRYVRRVRRVAAGSGHTGRPCRRPDSFLQRVHHQLRRGGRASRRRRIRPAPAPQRP